MVKRYILLILIWMSINVTQANHMDDKFLLWCQIEHQDSADVIFSNAMMKMNGFDGVKNSGIEYDKIFDYWSKWRYTRAISRHIEFRQKVGSSFLDYRNAVLDAYNGEIIPARKACENWADGGDGHP